MCKAVAGAGRRRVWIMNSLSPTVCFVLPSTPPPPLHKTWILKYVTGSGVLLVMIQGQHIGEVCRSRWRLTEWYDKPRVSALACQTQRVLICAIMVVLSKWGMTGRTCLLTTAYEKKLRIIGSLLFLPESTRWQTLLSFLFFFLQLTALKWKFGVCRTDSKVLSHFYWGSTIRLRIESQLSQWTKTLPRPNWDRHGGLWARGGLQLSPLACLICFLLSFVST